MVSGPRRERFEPLLLLLRTFSPPVRAFRPLFARATVEVPPILSGEHVPDFLPSRLGLNPREVFARIEECVGVKAPRTCRSTVAVHTFS